MDQKDITQDEFEKIEAYLSHSLSNEEMILFKERLKNDQDFATKVEDVKIIITGIESQALKEQLNDFHEELSSHEKDAKAGDAKVISLQWKRIAVAAVVMVVAGSLWFFNLNSNSGLYSDFYKPDPGLPTVMSSNNNYEFYNAMVSYKQGDYNKALKTWKHQLMTKVDNDTLNYFVASALMADKQEDKAIPYFQEVTSQERSVFINEAWYYLGLAYLKTNNKEKAVESLEQSVIPKATKLLEKLE